MTDTNSAASWGGHAHLLDLGYVHTHVEADWEDVGTGESGPCPKGGPAFDEYMDKDTTLIVVDGRVVELYQGGQDLEEWCTSAGIGQREPDDTHMGVRA